MCTSSPWRRVPRTPFRQIHDVFGDDIVYIPYLFADCDDYPDYAHFAADLLEQGPPQTRFWFAMAEGWVDAVAIRQRVREHATATSSPRPTR